jgi:glycolate oxidase iron-sulfur subunit
MQHSIPTEQLGPWGQPMSEAVRACVHCGFCLPTCPTYRLMGEEMDSPRGRIFLMKEVLEGSVELDNALPFIDRCLGCVGCVTACPSGVQYGELLTAFRAHAEPMRGRTWSNRMLRAVVLNTLPYPFRFRVAVTLGRWTQPWRRLLPKSFGNMLDLLPREIPESSPLPLIHPAEGKRRGRVALLTGCAQQVLAPDINWATLRVLSRNGVETYVPREQTCCGALAAHTGAIAQAQRFARRNLRAFPSDVDAIVTNAAGCGSGMHEYPLWLRGTSDERLAAEFSRQVCDVSVYLDHLGFIPPHALTRSTRVAYHDACHLAHAQNVRQEPRRLLTATEKVRLIEIPHGDICCGSAGTYNIEQPTAASELGGEKARIVIGLEPDVVVSGNIGCLTQLQHHLSLQGSSITVMHTMQFLDRAYGSQESQIGQRNHEKMYS